MGKRRRCPKCKEMILVGATVSPAAEPDLESFRFLQIFASSGQAAKCGLGRLSKENLRALNKLLEGVVMAASSGFGFIEDVKYDGRLIVLDDGSRWEVDEACAHEAEVWLPGDEVAIHNGEMFNLAGCERISVFEE